MLRRLPLLLLALSFLAGVTQTHAQFLVTQTIPEPGQTNVDPSTTVAFGFSDPIDFELDLNTAFPYYPTEKFVVDEVLICLNLTGDCGGTGSAKYVRHVGTHASDTDFIWIVDAIQNSSGAFLDEPHVLHYSTGPTVGQRSVSGTVSAAPSLSAKRTVPTDRLRATLRTILHGAEANGFGPPVSRRSTSLTAKASSYDVTRIFLLNHFDPDEDAWTVQAADAIRGSSGSYRVNYVRDAVGGAGYWPIAVRYTGPNAYEIESVGFYDPDGDQAPDPVTVSGNSPGGIDLTLYQYPLVRAQTYLSQATQLAAGHLPNPKLVRIQAGHGIRPTGTAHEWTYTYVDGGREVIVTIDPLGERVTEQPLSSQTQGMAVLPSPFIDSETAMQVVLDDGGQAFIDQFDPTLVRTVMQGGDLYWYVTPSDKDRPFWRIRFQVVTATQTKLFTRYVDMDTGEILDPSSLPVELVSFVASVDGTDVQLMWETASETNNAGFEVLHGRPHMPRRSVGFRRGAGTTDATTAYRFVLRGLEPGEHQFQLRQKDIDGSETLSGVQTVHLRASAPLVVSLPAPHPIRTQSEISFVSAEAGPLRMELYDLLGRRVRTLFDGSVRAHEVHRVSVDGSAVPSAMYFVRVKGPTGHITHPIVVAH